MGVLSRGGRKSFRESGDLWVSWLGGAFQSILLGAIFVGIAASTDALYALRAGAVAPLLAGLGNAKRFGMYLSGSIFIGLGILAACASLKRG